MPDTYEKVRSYIEEHRKEMRDMWADFVNTPSQARDREAAIKMGEKLVVILETLGLKVTMHDAGEFNSFVIEAIWGEERGGKPILFAGHYDTVNSSPVPDAKPGDPDEFDGTPHFRVDEEGKAYGLGVLDMQGGLVITIWILKALQEIGWKERPIKILWAGDEDKGHQQSDSPEIIKKIARGSLCCFNMETGRINNDICIGRKGGGEGRITIRGVAAHAGNDYENGRNAVLEAAYKAADLAKLTNLEEGTTVSPDVIHGGTVANGIPDFCELKFDFRYQKYSEAQRVWKGLDEIGAKTYIDGTTTDIWYNEYTAPFDMTPAGIALADYVAKVSEEHGLGKMGKVFLGGGSDASYITIAGVPTICAMGVCGQFNHSSKEYAFTESLYTRTKLMTCAVLEIEKWAGLNG